MHKFLFTVVALAFIAGCTQKTAEANNQHSDAEKSVYQAHLNYVSAINSNNIDSLLAMLTEDVVYLPAGEPVIVGKEAVKPWISGYFDAFKTEWIEQIEEIVVMGDWAFERHSAQSRDSSYADGQVYTSSSWGLVIYHLDTDSVWRVARDAWGPDKK